MGHRAALRPAQALTASTEVGARQQRVGHAAAEQRRSRPTAAVRSPRGRSRRSRRAPRAPAAVRPPSSRVVTDTFAGTSSRAAASLRICARGRGAGSRACTARRRAEARSRRGSWMTPAIVRRARWPTATSIPRSSPAQAPGEPSNATSTRRIVGRSCRPRRGGTSDASGEQAITVSWVEFVSLKSAPKIVSCQDDLLTIRFRRVPSSRLRASPRVAHSLAWLPAAFIAEHATERFERELGPPVSAAKHASVLVVIDAEGPMSQRALGRRLRIDKSPMVGLVDDLERLGLAERRRERRRSPRPGHPPDRRGPGVLARVTAIADAENARTFGVARRGRARASCTTCCCASPRPRRLGRRSAAARRRGRGGRCRRRDRRRGGGRRARRPRGGGRRLRGAVDAHLHHGPVAAEARRGARDVDDDALFGSSKPRGKTGRKLSTVEFRVSWRPPTSPALVAGVADLDLLLAVDQPREHDPVGSVWLNVMPPLR